MNNAVKVSVKHRYIYTRGGLPIYWMWCHKTFGPANNSTYGCPATEHYWRVGESHTMWFAKPEHATMFALRWA